MTSCDRGDVVLVSFVFAGDSGSKRRPALVVSSSAYNHERQDLIVAAITSNIRRRLFGDHLIAEWKQAGLLLPSLVTGILRTIERAMVERQLGVMRERDLAAVDLNLRRALGLQASVGN